MAGLMGNSQLKSVAIDDIHEVLHRRPCWYGAVRGDSRILPGRVYMEVHCSRPLSRSSDGCLCTYAAKGGTSHRLLLEAVLKAAWRALRSILGSHPRRNPR